jgi:PAS domain S-box-containing protein
VNNDSRLWLTPPLHKTPQAAAVLVITLGWLVLIGWLLDIDLLKTALPGLDAMRPTTAVGLILAGASLLLMTQPTTPRRHRWGQIGSLGVIAIGLTTLVNYVANWPVRINPLFFTHYVAFIPSVPVGHMSPLTGICFLLMGSALGISSTRHQWRRDQERWVEILALFSSLIAGQVLVAYLYRVEPIIGFRAYQQMPLHGAIAFIVLAVGLVLAHPNQGFVGILTADSVGGAVARRLLPAAIAVPLALGGFRIATARMSLFDPDFGTSLLAVLHTLIFAGIVALNAQQLHRIDLQRQAAQRALAQINAELEDRIADRTAQLQAANERLNLAIEGAGMATWDLNLHTETAVWSDQAFKLMGYEPAPGGSASFEMWHSRIHPDDLVEVMQSFAEAQRHVRLFCPEHRILRADNGQAVWLRVFGRFLYSAAGEATRFVGIFFDDTEWKETEQAQQQLATIIENSPDFIGTADLSGQLRYLNPAGRQMVGLDPTAPLDALNGTDFHPPERNLHMKEVLLPKLLEQGVWQEETLLQHFQTGELIPVYQTAFVNRDRKTGQPLSIATVIRDIRERKQAEANLRESEERFRSAVLYSPLPIMLHAEDGEVIAINHSWSDLSGYSPTDIRTIADWTEKAYGSRQETVQADIDHLHQLDQRVSEGEYILKTRSGKTRIWDFYSAPLGKLPDGRSLVISTAIDITERKQAEADLRQSLKDLADFKFALDQSSIVAITDADGIITYVNDKFCELSQYSRAELIGQNHRIISSGYHPKAFFRQMWSTIAAGQVWQGEIRNRAKDGSYYWVATTIVPFLDQQGRPYQYIAVRSDITTRKTAEAELQQLNVTLEQRVEERTAQLQDSNRNLEAFSYTVAHDLRAPLRSIQGFTQALLEDYGSELDELAQEYIESVFEGAQRMNQLIDDLLTYSRLSSEQIHLSKVLLAQVVEVAQSQLAADLGQQQAQVEVAPALPSVIGQRTILVQMLVNLLSNAIKFVPPDTRPQVKIWAETLTDPAAVACPNVPTQPRVRLWVEDNGIGIEPEYQEQVFGVFERLHSRDTYPGTGIGLAIVRKGAERLGGCAGVESAPGQGSRFWIELQGVE